ncbi:7870_t:CDS:2 [Entrophospora sp. SA101]|nr:12133_t:CDS:2 [Entrophospora sp. SA101]CAJ0651886.1 12136_t:CDS:2 [Entrophospora sp. SA101]CAJ0757047.1 7870_t:CDS:2 [Entrophospora sp. SA101]CAJ0840277.1 10341_t:CDS:2 [Entrophospora sp. SA101]
MKFNDKEQNSTVISLNNYNVLRNNIKKLIKQLVELFMYKDEEDIDVDDAMKGAHLVNKCMEYNSECENI